MLTILRFFNVMLIPNLLILFLCERAIAVSVARTILTSDLAALNPTSLNCMKNKKMTVCNDTDVKTEHPLFNSYMKEMKTIEGSLDVTSMISESCPLLARYNFSFTVPTADGNITVPVLLLCPNTAISTGNVIGWF